MKRDVNQYFLRAFLCAFLLLLGAAVCACVPTTYNTNDQKEVEEASRKLLTEWLETLPEQAELTEVSMVHGWEPGENPYAGYYLSHVSSARFTAGGNNYVAYVNNEDGTIWTDYYGIDVESYLEDLIRPYCEAYGYTGDFRVTSVSPRYDLRSHDITSWRDPVTESEVVIAYTKVIPADITNENADERIPELLREAAFEVVDILYASEEGLSFDLAVLTDYMKENSSTEGKASEVAGQNGMAEGIFLSVDIQVGDGSGDDRFPQNSIYQGVASGRMFPEAGLDQSTFRYEEYSVIEDGAIAAEYLAKGWEGSVSEFDRDAIDTRPCPLEIDGNTIRHTGANCRVPLYFTEEPEFTKAAYRYPEEDSESEPKELKVVQLENGYWSLTDEENGYPKGFWFNEGRPQELVLE